MSENKSMKDTDNVRVVVRSRPINDKEKESNYKEVVKVDEMRGTVTVQNPDRHGAEPPKTFTFDIVIAPDCKQLDVYNKVARPVVDCVLEGYNGTIFAYGKTGTGKTFTMEGLRAIPEKRGIIPNSFAHIFAHIAKAEGDKRFLVRVSYLEIFNEEIRDLLAKDQNHRLQVKEQPDVGVYVKDLSAFVVNNADDMDRIMTLGNKNRSVRSTDMNLHSSRSHAFFTVTVECSEKGVDGEQHVKVGKLHLVDLAGSERQAKTGATAQYLKEASKISLSLTPLASVICSLVDGKSTHIPYRNSKLTRLLQDSLGGNSKTIMVANICPVDFNYDESISTLRYAYRAKKIKNKAKVNEDPKDALLRQFQKEIDDLKKQLEDGFTDDEGSEEESGSEKEIIDENGVKRKVKKENGAHITVKRHISKEKMNEIQSKFDKDRRLLESKKDMAEDEINKVKSDLEKKEAKLKKYQNKQEQLQQKLSVIEKKIIIGGENLEKAEEQERLLEESAKELEACKEKEDELKKPLEDNEQERLDIEERYSSLQEEVAGETERVFTMLMQVKSEIADVQQEHQREMEGLLEDEMTERHVQWNDDIGEWQLRCVAYTGNDMREQTPQPEKEKEKQIGSLTTMDLPYQSRGRRMVALAISSRAAVTVDNEYCTSPFHTPEPAHEQNHSNNSIVPEQFSVDGTSRMEPHDSTAAASKKRKRDVVKDRRNSGLSYLSPTSQRTVPQRQIGETCKRAYCAIRNLSCPNFSENSRTDIFLSFWNIGNLQEQRNWVAHHIVVNPVKYSRCGDESTSRRQQTIVYTLPHSSGTLPVCKTMFLNTLALTGRFIRTVLDKTTVETGVLQGEMRGGHRNLECDLVKKNAVSQHIDRFPRVESRYCRATSSYEYLSADLNLTKMFDMYKTDDLGKDVSVSYNFYKKIFNEKNLKFHVPKKNLCDICEMKHSVSTTSAEFDILYEKHMQEETKSQELLSMLTEEAISSHKIEVAIFDSEKVLSLPQSQRGEIFYKRRLSCYNFTIHEVSSGQGFCYFWHEGQAGRGANEKASCLKKYADSLDSKGIETLHFFSDGCAGQNKNFVIPTMLRHLLKSSKALQTVTMQFFKTSHGQSVGDSIHSLVERKMKKVQEIFVPSELVGIIKSAAKSKPFIVTEMETGDIFDWKAVAASSGILKIRQSDGGLQVKWPDMVEIKLNKCTPDKIFFKQTRNEDTFEILTLPHRMAPEIYASKAYTTAPKLSKGKFDDLMSMCSDPTPVIRYTHHKQYYQNLPHN